MARVIRISIPDGYDAQVLAGLEGTYDRRAGETAKSFVRRLIKDWFRETVLRHETHLAAGSVQIPDDLVEVTEDP